METKMPKRNKPETQIVGNTGMYYVCYQLSLMGWNVMPTARNARGVDVIAYNLDSGKYRSIQVKTLSYRNQIPLGRSINKILADYWIIVVLSDSEAPSVYILSQKEMESIQIYQRTNKKGEVSFWLLTSAYEEPEYKNR